MNTQRGLFDAPVDSEQLLLDDADEGCRVRYWDQFVPTPEARNLFEELLHEAPFESETVTVHGQTHTTLRRSCAFSDSGVRGYSYAGVVRMPWRWHVSLLPLLPRIRAVAGCPFNFALCSLYPDGAAGLGWHSDDEDDLEPGAPIASLSLGAARDFSVRQLQPPRLTLSQCLSNGSLLLMEGARFQERYRHCLPERLRCHEPRINLTFRRRRGQ